MKEQQQVRRVASNQVLLPSGQTLLQTVVELQSGQVLRYYPLDSELPQTEWLSGLIQLREEPFGDGLCAYYKGKKIE
jgi:hypothetical protein